MVPQSFSDLHWIRDLLAEFRPLWFVAGGWAIDLHVGRVTRPHQDTEVAILRRDQEDLRTHLPNWDFQHVVPGRHRVFEPWKEETRLEPPIHEVQALGPKGEELEVLLNESTGGVWRFRRMVEIARPLSMMGHTSSAGIPFLAPEIVLLYKAKEPGDVDERDFQVARPLLPEEASEWLRISVEACYPDHPWLASLR